MQLDTRVYGAHTTAADGLWTGLPLVTCPGASFASRVGYSLLRALPRLGASAGEGEGGRGDFLVRGPAAATLTHSLREYEAASVTLAAAGQGPLLRLRRSIQAAILAVRQRQGQQAAGGRGQRAPALVPIFDADAYTAQLDRVARAGVDVRATLEQLAMARQQQEGGGGGFGGLQQKAAVPGAWRSAGLPPFHLIATEAT